jgi:hypothetical protein
MLIDSGDEFLCVEDVKIYDAQAGGHLQTGPASLLISWAMLSWFFSRSENPLGRYFPVSGK